jgi:peptide deformylase
MSVLPIHIFGSQVLRAKAKPLRAIKEDTIKLIMDMFETMKAASGIGLAATQVGSLERIITLDLSALKDNNEEGEERLLDVPRPIESLKPIIMINPHVESERGSWKLEEGCLSLPEIREEVKRAERIKVRYRDANFEEQTLDAAKMLARVVLHEIDHLNGILFFDHLSRTKQTMLKSKLRKLKKGEVETNYPIISPAHK